MSYCISAIKNGERTFFGSTPTRHYLFSKNPQYILHFKTLDDAKNWWDKMLPFFDRRMFEGVEDISAGNINYSVLTWLEKEVKD